MNRRGFQADDEGTFLLDVFKIALGVFIGGLAAAFSYEAILVYRAEQALRKVSDGLKADADRIRARTAKQDQLTEQARADEQQRSERVRAAQALAARLEAERKDRMEAAWNRFYQPSPPCKLDSGTTACANEYMSARKRFDSQYVDR